MSHPAAMLRRRILLITTKRSRLPRLGDKALWRDPGSECGKQFAGQIAGSFLVGPALPSHVVVQNPTVGRPMDVRLRQVHSIPFNGIGYAADKYDRSVRVDLFHNPDVRERIVVPTVSIRIPRIVKKHQIAGMDHRPSVNPALRQHMVVN